jgi:preprotein translocase SecE subunit
MAFGIYKPGQAKYTRLATGFGLGIIVGLGCLILYRKLEGADLGLWVATMIPAGLLFIFVLAIVILLNRPLTADFMISAEGELKKVSWSSRREVAVSTFIVIACVAILASLLGITDLFFELLFQWLLR